jgi:hypothetical protein
MPCKQGLASRIALKPGSQVSASVCRITFSYKVVSGWPAQKALVRTQSELTIVSSGRSQLSTDEIRFQWRKHKQLFSTLYEQ